MKNCDIKLIALDIDGTLLNENREITVANRQAIKEAKEKGIYVVLSTGRSIIKCREHAKSLELSSYLVTVNGSEIWDEKEELMERNPLSSEHIQWMWELTQKHQTNFWAISTDQIWNDEMPEDIHALEWLKFGFDIRDDEVRKIIFQELHKKGLFELSNSHPKNIEVNAIGINKAKGLEKVCTKLGIAMENVMAIGDSQNDIAMIREAGIGVAMGNAQEIVKKEADWVTASNEEDGVAVAIQKWVLKEEE